MSDLDKAINFATEVTRGAVALTLLEELGEVVTRHEARQSESYAQFTDRTHRDNDKFVGELLDSVRRARMALDDIEQGNEDYGQNED